MATRSPLALQQQPRQLNARAHGQFAVERMPAAHAFEIEAQLFVGSAILSDLQHRRLKKRSLDMLISP